MVWRRDHPGARDPPNLATEPAAPPLNHYYERSCRTPLLGRPPTTELAAMGHDDAAAASPAAASSSTGLRPPPDPDEYLPPTLFEHSTCGGKAPTDEIAKCELPSADFVLRWSSLRPANASRSQLTPLNPQLIARVWPNRRHAGAGPLPHASRTIAAQTPALRQQTLMNESLLPNRPRGASASPLRPDTPRKQPNGFRRVLADQPGISRARLRFGPWFRAQLWLRSTRLAT